jgi:predicted KAP-like P-loop ATPase
VIEAPKFSRISQIEIQADDPFINDCLNRKPLIENLTNLLASTTNPFVLSVEASWGYGKTTFVKMWQQYLAQQGFVALYFNAWENDFVEDPFLAFIVSITSQIEEINKDSDLVDKAIKVKKVGGKIIKKALPIALAAISRGVLDKDTFDSVEKFISDGDISDLVSETATKSIEAFENQKSDMVQFKEALEELIDAISDKKKLPLVIFVDELDRCRPDFSLSLLEKIKHLFNVNGIFFVLSVDRRQLENSVRAIYGNDWMQTAICTDL